MSIIRAVSYTHLPLISGITNKLLATVSFTFLAFEPKPVYSIGRIKFPRMSNKPHFSFCFTGIQFPNNTYGFFISLLGNCEISTPISSYSK